MKRESWLKSQMDLSIQAEVKKINQKIKRWHKEDETSESVKPYPSMYCLKDGYTVQALLLEAARAKCLFKIQGALNLFFMLLTLGLLIKGALK